MPKTFEAGPRLGISREGKNEPLPSISEVGEVAKGAAKGIGKAPLEIFQSLVELAKFGAEAMGDQETAKKDAATISAVESWQDSIDEFFGKTDSIAGRAAESLAQWLTVAGPTKAALGFKNAYLSWVTAGAFADFAAMDPHAKRLSNILVEDFGLKNDFLRWVAQDDDRGPLANRITAAIEGSALGLGTDGALKLIGSLPALKGYIKARAAMNQIGEQALKGNVSKFPDELVPLIKPGQIKASQVPVLSGDKFDQMSDAAAAEIIGKRPEPILVETLGGKPNRIIAGEDTAVAAAKMALNNDKAPDIYTLTIELEDLNKAIKEAPKAREAYQQILNNRSISQRKSISIFDKLLDSKNWIDVSGPLKKKMIEEGGQVGKEAVYNFENILGAGPYADRLFQKASDSIYGGLEPKVAQNLDEMILMRRIARGLDSSTISKEAAQGRLLELQRDLGPDIYSDLVDRSNRYLTTVENQIKEGIEEGFLDEEDMSALLRTTQPTDQEFVQSIDPILRVGLGKDVTESGIYHFSDEAFQEKAFDTRHMLHQITARIQARRLRNKASLKLEKLARELDSRGEKDPIVTLKAPEKKDQGKWVEIRAYHGQGDFQKVWMQKDFGEQWYDNRVEVSQHADVLRLLSGSIFVRPLATGYNPAFVLKNWPREVMHNYFSLPKEVGFSTNPAIYMAQLAKDYAAVAKDAITKTGAFEDAAREGMLMPFLTHQGRDLLLMDMEKRGLLKGLGDSVKNAAREKSLRSAKEALSYINELSEVWNRLAVRHRALSNGLSPAEATAHARRTADFSQGGIYAKNVDQVKPYFNAWIQTVRPVLREMRNDPARFMQKIGWVSAAASANHLYQMTRNPEGYDQVRDETKMLNTVVMFPDSFSITDELGNKRHFYLTLRRDETLSLFTAPFEAAMLRYGMGHDVDVSWWNSLKDASGMGFLAGGTVPAMDAMLAYFENTDVFTGREPWPSLEFPVGWIEPEEEFTVFPKGDTPQIWRDVGSFLHMSPDRLNAAMGKLFPSNLYTSTIGNGYDFLFRNLNEPLREQAVMETIANSAFLGRVIHMTNPLSREYLAIKDTARKGLSEDIDLQRAFQGKYYDALQKGGDFGEVTGWISTLKPIDKVKMLKTFEKYRTVDQVWKAKAFDTKGFVPERQVWQFMASKPAKVRADAIFELMRRSYISDAERRKIWKIAHAIPGFWTENVQLRWNEQKKLFREEFSVDR